MPRAAHHAALAASNGKIYVCGGFIAPEKSPLPIGAAWQPIDNVWEYDPAADSWRPGAPAKKEGAPAKKAGAPAAKAGPTVRGQCLLHPCHWNGLGNLVCHARLDVRERTVKKMPEPHVAPKRNARMRWAV